MRIRWSVVVAVVLSLVIGACEPGTRGGTLSPTSGADVVPALRYAGPTVSDDWLDLASFGGRPVAFWFWEPGCRECDAAAPTVDAAYRSLHGAVAVVGVTCTFSLDEARAFEDRNRLTLPSLVDRNGWLRAELDVPCQPAWAFVAADGTVTTALRTLDFDELTDRLDLLARAEPLPA